jgi:hypothetical protein
MILILMILKRILKRNPGFQPSPRAMADTVAQGYAGQKAGGFRPLYFMSLTVNYLELGLL